MTAKQSVGFRIATLDDVPQLADLRWRFKTDDAVEFSADERSKFIAAFVESVSASLSDGTFCHWVAEADGRIVAAMSVAKVRKVPSPELIESCWGYLTNCYTLPDYRNAGIGSTLLGAVTQWAKDQGYEFLSVWPSDRSYPFYERGGFNRYVDPLILKIDEQE
jgi:N-acetylglutamate synthase and related acetyltransferases